MKKFTLFFLPIVAFLFVMGLTACAPSDAPSRPETAATVGPVDLTNPTLSPSEPTIASIPSGGQTAEVDYVYDGDTIDVILDGREYRLRYIGVDTPEREEPFYQEASDFNRELVEGQAVILVKDVSETDQYGRLLRYVYLPDGTFVNAEIIRNGMGRLVTFPPDVANTEYFRQLQEQARESSTGMWSRPDLVGPCDCDRNLYNCSDFQSRREAQTCFDYCMETVGEDVHKLSGRGDGVACRSLP
jgi:endonuclease YncB( thermonuclease family)